MSQQPDWMWRRQEVCAAADQVGMAFRASFLLNITLPARRRSYDEKFRLRATEYALENGNRAAENIRRERKKLAQPRKFAPIDEANKKGKPPEEGVLVNLEDHLHMHVFSLQSPTKRPSGSFYSAYWLNKCVLYTSAACNFFFRIDCRLHGIASYR